MKIIRHSLGFFFAAIIGGLVSAVLVLNVAMPQMRGDKSTLVNAGLSISDQTGMTLIDNFQCNQVERKVSLINGTEDNFRLSGNEPSRLHPRLDDTGFYDFIKQRTRNYDEKGDDRDLIDYFEVPSNISKGIVVVKLDISEPQETDSFLIGDLSFDGLERKTHFTTRLPHLTTKGGWQQDSYVFHINLADLRVENSSHSKIKTMFDFIVNAKDKQIIDLQISDDTAVDFAAIVVCQTPSENRGLTLVQYTDRQFPVDGLAHLSCRGGAKYSSCNPKAGDTFCEKELPVACFKEESSMPPDSMKDIHELENFWSSGTLALSAPVKGFDFETVDDVNAFCATSFGEDWRIANWHDGGGSEIVAVGDIKSDQRVWVDIKDQPYGTCWKRGVPAASGLKDQN